MIGTFEVKLTIEVEPFLLKSLELRQFKNDSTEPKNRIVLKLPPFFPYMRVKSAAISKLADSLVPSSCSDIFKALVVSKEILF